MGPRITNVITLYRYPGDPLPSFSCSERVKTLQGRQKWNSAGHNLKVGEVVFVKDDIFAHRKWLLARITATYPGSDGVVRVVDFECQGKKFQRSTHSIINFMDEPCHSAPPPPPPSLFRYVSRGLNKHEEVQHTQQHKLLLAGHYHQLTIINNYHANTQTYHSSKLNHIHTIQTTEFCLIPFPYILICCTCIFYSFVIR